MRLTCLCLLSVLAPSCGDSVSVNNSSPHGSVGGLIVDAATRDPLAGVSVTLIAGSVQKTAVTTSDTGFFSFSDVPAGTVIVQITPPDAAHWGATLTSVLPGNAGDFPVDNQALTLGPIGLVPSGDTFDFRVVDEQGAPVDGYEVALTVPVGWVDFSSGAAVARGERVLHPAATNDGLVSVANMPEYGRLGSSLSDGVVVTLPPYDVPPTDGVYEFAGGLHVFNMLQLDDPTPDIILDPGFLTSLTVLASTIGSFEGGVAGTPIPAVIETFDPIYMKFNLPIQTSVDVNVVDEDGTPISPPGTVITGDTLEMTFSGLAAGAEYNLHVHVVAAVGDRVIEGDFAAPFFTRSTADEVTVTGVRDAAASVIRLTFSEPVGTGSPGANNLAGGNCVLFFNADLGGAPLPIGDVAGELGNADCEGGRNFYAVEPDPQGPVGRSGFATVWEFAIPSGPAGQLPPATPLHILFSHVADPSFTIERVDGRPVSDFTGGRAILMP